MSAEQSPCKRKNKSVIAKSTEMPVSYLYRNAVVRKEPNFRLPTLKFTIAFKEFRDVGII